MKLIDFDGMFDEKLSEYISKNSDKYKEEEWEDIIPGLYKKFGDTVIKSIGKTPRQYYADMPGDMLIKSLKGHLKEGIPVSEFLCTEIEKRGLFQSLLPLLDGTEEEREYAMNLLASDSAAIPKYLDILTGSDDEDLKNRCVDYIKENSSSVIGRVLDLYEAGKDKEYMLEILSRTEEKSDRIFNILLTAFRQDDENIPMHASYLAAYGDERAVKYLLDKIDEEGIGFIEFRELKYAIEALGGEYTKERDFSSDPYYQMIKGDSPADITDIFSFINKKQ